MSKDKTINIPGDDGRLKSVGIIMDGNGRWAKARGLSRSEGHKAGAKVIKEVIETLGDLGVGYVTLYAFSTENWKRPKEEVDGIMNLLYGYLRRMHELKEEYDLSIRFIGDKSPLPEKLRKKCIELEEMSKDYSHILNIALNYGGRDEIVRAVNEAIKEGCNPVTEADISRHLYTADSPDPDLIIRTGGDFRISNFLLWQNAYSEIVVMDTLWPDFGDREIMAAVRDFYSRNRRFGGLDKDNVKK